jgi:hypothetical protein
MYPYQNHSRLCDRAQYNMIELGGSGAAGDTKFALPSTCTADTWNQVPSRVSKTEKCCCCCC